MRLFTYDTVEFFSKKGAVYNKNQIQALRDAGFDLVLVYLD